LSTHLQGAREVIRLTCLLIYFITCAFYDLTTLCGSAHVTKLQ